MKKVKKTTSCTIDSNPARQTSRRFNAALVAGVLFLSCAAVFAGGGVHSLFDNARPVVKVVLSGTVERNKETLTVEKAGEVKSGEVLRWHLVSENDGDTSAKNYKAVGQIPAGTVFAADSARAENAVVTYSIDGGKTFSAEPQIEEKQTDGTTKLVAAPASMFTQIRFEAAKPLEPNEKLDASYSVRVK